MSDDYWICDGCGTESESNDDGWFTFVKYQEFERRMRSKWATYPEATGYWSCRFCYEAATTLNGKMVLDHRPAELAEEELLGRYMNVLYRALRGEDQT